MKTKKHINFIIVVLLYPYIVSFRSDGDTSWTELRTSIGSGSFTAFSRDCSGDIVGASHIPMEDYGIKIDHQENHYRYGATAGYLSTEETVESKIYPSQSIQTSSKTQAQHGWYLNANAGLHWKYFGVDAGGLITNFAQPKIAILPAGLIRIGNRDGLFLSTSLLNNTPIATGGGFADIGLGYNFARPGPSLWIGACLGPYHESPQWIAYSIKYDLFVSSNVFINLRAQYAERSFGYTDNGMSVGGGIIF